MDLTAIIPAHNEEKHICATIYALGEAGAGVIKEIIVIDDGSRDNTARKAAEAGVRLISLKEKRGKAEAVYRGVLAANTDALVLLDADLEDTASYMPRLGEALLKENLDMVTAIIPERRGGFGFLRLLAHLGVRWLTDAEPCSQPLSGQRAIKKDVFFACWQDFKGFGLEIGLTVTAIKKGFKIKEMPLPLDHRRLGRTPAGFIHRGRQSMEILQTIYRLRNL